MALAYTAPTWTDGSGEGISASNLQAISNCIEGLVQGSDKAVHNVQINGSTITLTYADGTTENFTAADMKSIASIDKTGTAGLVDTYTITYTDGTTTTFTVTNGSQASGDMLQSDYDSTEAVKTAGGIPAYVSSQLDGWTASATAQTSGSDVIVVFDDLDNSYGYDLYFADELIGIKSMTKGTGTNTGIKLTYVLDGATSGVSVGYLRILK